MELMRFPLRAASVGEILPPRAGAYAAAAMTPKS